MSAVRALSLLLCLLVPAAAAAADAFVQIYLQPLAPDAAKLTIQFAAVSAVAADGSEHPLELNLRKAGAQETVRQRQFASGSIPAGTYAGFVITVRSATLRGEGGDVALVVPDTPLRIAYPFAVSSRQAALYWLELDARTSIADGFSFNPALSVREPSRPIVGNAGFVSNTGSHAITVFDKHLGQAVAAIGGCGGPAGLALDPGRRRLYVACSADDEIQAIDVATGEVIERARLSVGDRPRELALAPDGDTLVSVNSGSGSVCLFKAGPLVLQGRVPVGNGPDSATFDQSGSRAFVFNTLSSSISIVDIAGRAVTATVSTDAAPTRGVLGRRGDRLYVIHERSPYLTVLDSRRLSLVTRARLPNAASTIELDRVRGLLCIGSSRDPDIEFYDPNVLMPVFRMRTGAGASYSRVDLEGNALYLVAGDDRRLVIGRLTDRKIMASIDVGLRPYAVAVAGER